MRLACTSGNCTQTFALLHFCTFALLQVKKPKSEKAGTHQVEKCEYLNPKHSTRFAFSFFSLRHSVSLFFNYRHAWKNLKLTFAFTLFILFVLFWLFSQQPNSAFPQNLGLFSAFGLFLLFSLVWALLSSLEWKKVLCRVTDVEKWSVGIEEALERLAWGWMVRQLMDAAER